MAKRKPLSFNNEELTKNLEESTGEGIDAFFYPTPLPQAVKQKLEPKKEAQPIAKVKQYSKEAKMIKIKKETKQESNITSNITILQFTDDEKEELREPVYKAQLLGLQKEKSNR